MSSDDWSDLENDAVVASYFDMLGSELSGQPYNKAARNRLLQGQTGRSRGSIEYKLFNVSASFKGFGLPTIKGYQPLFNYQSSLDDSVARWLAAHPGWEPSLLANHPNGVDDPPALFVGTAPTLRNAPPPAELEKTLAVARHFYVAARDARNRALGQAGEERVVRHERSQLQHHGRDDLARRVRWVSREDGDGAGYDIASFTPDGSVRLIEVKTTNGWERTPFYISQNELAVATEHCERWCLFRLYDFATAPRAFELRPPLDAHVSLTATQFQASFN
jgi:hypothetical protein